MIIFFLEFRQEFIEEFYRSFWVIVSTISNIIMAIITNWYLNTVNLTANIFEIIPVFLIEPKLLM